MKKVFLFVFLLLIAFTAGTAQQDNIRQKHYNIDKNQLALEGYDVVSYFKEKKPQKGNQQHRLTYKGVTYQFKNESNKATFAQNPSQYEPAYGGWCALAIAKSGEKVAVDPLSYKISNGRLLLFYKNAFYSALNNWNKDKTSEADLLQKGDQYWNDIIIIK